MVQFTLSLVINIKTTLLVNIDHKTCPNIYLLYSIKLQSGLNNVLYEYTKHLKYEDK